MKIVNIPFNYYQHFDMDFSLEVPAKGMGGWKRSEMPMDADHTALVVMHSWEAGTREKYPGWHRAVEYIPREQAIEANELPRAIKAARDADMTVLHVAAGGEYLSRYPGTVLGESIAASFKPAQANDDVAAVGDEYTNSFGQFRSAYIFPGTHNIPDVNRGFAALDFSKCAKPLDNEPIATTSRQLAAICRSKNINHLIYIGFAINGCLLYSPGGMVDMARLGYVCSTVRQATTAIENRETAETEQGKEMALWLISIMYGAIYDLEDFEDMCGKLKKTDPRK